MVGVGGGPGFVFMDALVVVVVVVMLSVVVGWVGVRDVVFDPLVLFTLV